jgi:hypothetical protein
MIKKGTKIFFLINKSINNAIYLLFSSGGGGWGNGGRWWIGVIA